MKTYIITPCLLILVGIFLHSCKDKSEVRYMANTPIYQDFESFRSQSFSLLPARDITTSGKIWIQDDYLFVVDFLKGIHIFDNSDPSNPLNMGFLEVFACTDIAVNGNELYADNYCDLLTFNISDMQNPALQCRTESVFNFEAANVMNGYDSGLPAVGVIWEKGVITGWTQEEVTEEVEIYTGFMTNDIAILDSQSSEGNPSLSTVSVGGSMARFTITGNHLHVLERRTITTFNLTGSCLEQTSLTNINRIGETLFPAEGNLYVGTTTGMLIYSLSDPSAPSFMSDFNHVASCDPVVISGDRAYVTLRTGTRCQGAINELIIINIADLYNPTEIATYDMTNPHGLGITGSTLFLCDGTDGLKIFDVADPYDLGNNFISHFQDIQAYDVIPLENQLIMSAKEGIYQYDYSDLSSITQLSFIAVQ